MRRRCMHLCRPSVSPVGRSLDVSWGPIPCSPHIWAARLTRRPQEKKRKKPLEAMGTSCPAGPLVTSLGLLVSQANQKCAKETVMLCFGNTNVFGQRSPRTVPVIHKSERKERWIAGSNDTGRAGWEQKYALEMPKAGSTSEEWHTFGPAGSLII